MMDIIRLDHVQISRILMPSSTARLDVTNHSSVKIKTGHKVALWDIEAFFGDRCGEYAVEFAFPEIRDSPYLLFEGDFEIANASADTNQEPSMEMGTADMSKNSMQKSCCFSLFYKNNTPIVSMTMVVLVDISVKKKNFGTQVVLGQRRHAIVVILHIFGRIAKLCNFFVQ